MRARFDTYLLPEGLRATGYRVDGATITVDAGLIEAGAAFPSCRVRSAHRHWQYVRSLAGLPAHGRPVRVRLSVQRYRCMTTFYPTKTFSETVSMSLARRHGRRTGRFQDFVAYLGRAMGGHPAQALGRRMLFGVSKDTFLRGAT